MDPSTLKKILIEGDTIFSKEIKTTIIESSTNKVVKDMEEKNRTTQLERWSERTPLPGLNVEQVLEILERSTGRHWIYIYEDEIFEHHDWDVLVSKCGDYDGDYVKFSEPTMKKVNELGYVFD